MAGNLCTIEEIKGLLEFDITPGEEKVGGNSIPILSDMARHYGNASWSAANVPPVVKWMIAQAIARHLRDPMGFTRSSAMDESASWDPGSKTIGAKFLPDEIKIIQEANRGVQVFTVQTTTTGPSYGPAIPPASWYIPARPGPAWTSWWQ